MNDDVMVRERADETVRSAEGTVEIGASIERVWQALTDASELERWFPLRARVEPGEGGSIAMSWGNEFSGSSEILTWQPPYLLRTTWGAPAAGDAALVTEYVLESVAGGRTRVRVVTSGFPEGATWDAWLEDTRRGWAFELVSLRRYLEHHAGRDRAVVYLRRRVKLGIEEVWRRVSGADGLLPTQSARREVIDDAPPLQFAAVLNEPAGAMLRVSLEPTGTTGDERDVTIWLSDWSGDAVVIKAFEAASSSTLERLFPEGRTV